MNCLELTNTLNTLNLVQYLNHQVALKKKIQKNPNKDQCFAGLAYLTKLKATYLNV